MNSKFLYFISTLCLAWMNSLGQETKLKQHDSEKFYEEYSVLVSDKKTKHGQYTLFIKPFIGSPQIKMTGNYKFGKRDGLWTFYFDTPMNQKKETGHYKEDLKDSLWVTFYPEAKLTKLVFNDNTKSLEIININTLVRSVEYYKIDKPVGIWEFYTEEQKKIQVFDFDKDSLLFDSHLTDKSNVIDHQAIFIGGDYRINQLLHDAFDFQELMKGIDNKVNLKSGTLKIEVTIDEHGEMHAKELENTINNEKIVKRAFSSLDSLKGFWIPGRKSNVPTSTARVIQFKINPNVTHSKYSRTITVEYSIDI